MIKNNMTMDPQSYAFDADAEEAAYMALETYIYQHMSAPNENDTLAIPDDFRHLVNTYIENNPYVDNDYDFLNLVFRTASTMTDRYHTWRDWIEHNVKDYPELQAKYDDFVRYQERIVVRY